MRTLRLSLIVCAVSVLLVPVARAQELPKPGPEHEHLKQMEGTWDVTVEGGGKGTMTYKMGLGGLWLLSKFEGEFGGMKFEGRGMDTYDPTIKKYRGVWVDSMGTAPLVMQGDFDKNHKVLTMTGERPGPDGKPAKYKTVTTIKDKDTIQFALFITNANGKEQQMATMDYKRKK